MEMRVPLYLVTRQFRVWDSRSGEWPELPFSEYESGTGVIFDKYRQGSEILLLAFEA